MGRALMLLACTCGGQGTRLNAARIHLRRAKVFGVGPCTPKDTLSCFVVTMNTFLSALTALKYSKPAKKRIFPPFVPYSSAPWWPIQKATTSFRAAWPKLPSLRVSSKYSNVEGNLSKKNPRSSVTCISRSSIPESEPPRFARWLNEV